MTTGYRSVNFMSLCRLCITGTTTSGTHIFSAEGRKKKLPEKIKECLPAVIEEHDDLPKIVCNQCIDQIENITQYRNSCLNAQVMLEGCLTSGTIKSSGKVYIKEPSEKESPPINKVHENIQSQQRNTNAIGRENNSPLEEFLKMKPNLRMGSGKKKEDIKFVIQKETKPTIGSLVFDQPIYNEIKDKKINIVLAPNLNEHLYSQIENSQSLSSNILQQTSIPQTNALKPYITKLTTNNQICTDSLNTSMNAKQCMLPITIKNQGSADKQIIAHINTKNLVLPTYQLHMKLQPNTNSVDRQTVVQLTPASVPISIQPVTSNLNQFHVSSSNTMPLFLTDCKQPNTNLKGTSFHISSDKKNLENQATIISSETIPNTNTHPTQFSVPQKDVQKFSGIPSKIANVFLNKPGITINRVVNTQNQTTSTPITGSIDISCSTQTQNQKVENSPEVKEVSTKTSLATPKVTQTVAATISEFKCKVCQKSFKKKEHMTQHMKLHAGLRPFKCNEQYCNKAFSRKEHLMRHIVSHTGKKLFHCDICQKFFSRKDNLNKHRRTHTETANNNVEFVCEICQKSFVVKMYYIQHKLQCFKEIQSTGTKITES